MSDIEEENRTQICLEFTDDQMEILSSLIKKLKDSKLLGHLGITPPMTEKGVILAALGVTVSLVDAKIKEEK